MNQRELERAISREVESWPGVQVEFKSGAKHPKAVFTFGEKTLFKNYPGTPSDGVFGLHRTLGDMRRVMKQLGAERDKPEPSEKELEREYAPPNNGREERPDPVEREPVKPKRSLGEKLADVGVVDRAAVQAAESAATYARRKFVEEQAPAPPAPANDEPSLEAEAARIMAEADAIVDGVYFGLDDRVYHAVPRLSASGVQKLCVSPGTFWASSWLNPDHELDLEPTDAQVLGKAYHCARLEPERFQEAYARQPEKADWPKKGTAWNGTEIEKHLESYGEPKKRAGEKVADQARRLADCGFPHAIWPLIEADFQAELGARIPIPGRYYDEIVRDMDRLQASADIHELLTGGQAEVSIFWTDSNGFKWKARTDYLRPDAWADFKTFDNSRGKVLEQALADAMRFNRYHVQAVIYRHATEAVRVDGLAIIGEATDEQRALVEAIQARPDGLRCHYVFQEKGGIPNLLAREFPFWNVPIGTVHDGAGASDEQRAAAERGSRTKTQLHTRALQDIRQAMSQFALYSQVYEPGQPWAPIEPMGAFDDAQFNRYWLEGVND